MANKVQRAAASIAGLLLRGDVALATARALALADELGVPRRPVSPAPGLPLLAWRAPVDGPVIPRPGDPRCGLVPCVLFGGSILLKTCALRQSQRAGGRQTKRRDRAGQVHQVHAGMYPECYGGRCVQGLANLRRLPKDWKAPRYNRLRRDFRAQLDARERWRREHLEDVRTIDDE